MDRVIDEMGVRPGALLAAGRTADVFAWSANRVLKLFRTAGSKDTACREFAAVQAVRAAGLETPAVHEVLEVEGRWGLVFDRVQGLSILQRVSQRPWSFYRYDRILPELHRVMHRSTHGLPSLRQRLVRMIARGSTLASDLRDETLELLEKLPDGDAVCHGDFHPGNVLLTSAGPIVIDWQEACSGRALADVAMTSLLLQAGLPPGRPHPLLSVGRRWFRRCYLRFYFEQSRPREGEFRDWHRVVAAALLNSGKPLNRRVLLEILTRGRRKGRPTCGR